ncbi:hypothetical protein [Thiomicrospira sp. WB1]|uniref:hypothetical protein n=1 Tax=Thiomicrospira sp. WB1 TaxID=1685380 RepID=UPI000AAF8FD7|nr:hypothetical protein [Thiomicrospira sp. WB1]
MRTRSLQETFDLYLALDRDDPLNKPLAPREYLNGLRLLTTRAEIEANLNDFAIDTPKLAHPQTLALFAALIDEICDCLSLDAPDWTRHPGCVSPSPYPKVRDVGQHQRRNLFVYDLLSEHDQRRLQDKPA